MTEIDELAQEAAKARQQRARREDQLADGMLDGPKTVGGLQLRPFSFGTLQVARKLNLRMFAEEAEELSDGQAESEIVAFAWIQSQPIDHVLACVRESRAWDEIERFAFDLDIDAIAAISEEVNRMSASVAEASVKVDPKDKPEKSKETPPGKSVAPDGAQAS